MTYIIDMITGETLVTDKPCKRKEAVSSSDFPPANESLVLTALQPVSGQPIPTDSKPGIANIDMTRLFEEFDK